MNFLQLLPIIFIHDIVISVIASALTISENSIFFLNCKTVHLEGNYLFFLLVTRSAQLNKNYYVFSHGFKWFDTASVVNK